jgi:hypothetical protein
MRNVVAVLTLVFLAATGRATVDTSKLPRMGVDFAFDQKHKCQGSRPRSD